MFVIFYQFQNTCQFHQTILRQNMLSFIRRVLGQNFCPRIKVILIFNLVHPACNEQPSTRCTKRCRFREYTRSLVNKNRSTEIEVAECDTFASCLVRRRKVQEEYRSKIGAKIIRFKIESGGQVLVKISFEVSLEADNYKCRCTSGKVLELNEKSPKVFLKILLVTYNKKKLLTHP